MYFFQHFQSLQKLLSTTIWRMFRVFTGEKSRLILRVLTTHAPRKTLESKTLDGEVEDDHEDVDEDDDDDERDEPQPFSDRRPCGGVSITD